MIKISKELAAECRDAIVSRMVVVVEGSLWCSYCDTELEPDDENYEDGYLKHLPDCRGLKLLAELDAAIKG